MYVSRNIFPSSLKITELHAYNPCYLCMPTFCRAINMPSLILNVRLRVGKQTLFRFTIFEKHKCYRLSLCYLCLIQFQVL